MAIAQWNDAEDDALQGLPHDAQLLYLRGLRRMMDFRTGEVGRASRISWQALREALYVEPQRGCADTGSPHRERVRRLAGHLERAGLVEMRSRMEDKQLIFFLPLADRDKSVRKIPDRNPTEKPDTAKPKQDKAFKQKADRPETAKPDRHPISDKTNCNGYITEISPAREDENQKASAGSLDVGATSPEVRLAVFLRSLGVDVLPLNALLSQWVHELEVTEEECLKVVTICRQYINASEPIPYKYFDRVLRSQRRGPRQSKTDRRRAQYEQLTGKSRNIEPGNVIEHDPVA